jgi:hypothetical protein
MGVTRMQVYPGQLVGKNAAKRPVRQLSLATAHNSKTRGHERR